MASDVPNILKGGYLVNYIRATWAGPWVELLLWRPQRAVPALHGALWGWVRLAVAGVAGAHERPLALLLLHLGAAQARS